MGRLPSRLLGIAGDTVQYLENIGVSNYHALQVRLEKRFSAGISGLASYTWGKALTNAVDHLSTSGVGNGTDVGAFREAQNGFDRTAEYGPAEFDVKHRFVASAVWQLPFGFEIAPILAMQSGLALTVTQSEPISLGGERRSRPNRIASGELAGGPANRRQLSGCERVRAHPNRSDTRGFTPGQIFGTSGVGILRGPGFVNVDLNLTKMIMITERHRIQFRAEFFNLFNHTNLNVPGVNLGARLRADHLYQHRSPCNPVRDEVHVLGTKKHNESITQR